MGIIVIVEDNKKTAEIIEKYISDTNKALLTVHFSKAADAYDYAKKEHVKLFIIDIQLLDYKGTSLAQQIREIPEYKFTPIIFATALAGEELSVYREIKCLKAKILCSAIKAIL